MRVVIDTNILVSFAIRPSPNFEKFFDHLAAHGISLVSEDAIAELLDVLSRDKFRKYIPFEQCLDYVEWYAGVSEQVAITELIVARDYPKDDKFLSVAFSGKADCNVAGDRHLLDMRRFREIPLYRPAEFISRFIR